MNIVIALGLVITIATLVPVVIQLRQHPRGLVVLFMAEMWERFSYYGMRALLIFYLTQHFLFDDRFSQGQYGAYTSLVYLLPIIGGVLADRYLGNRKAIGFGALLLVVGHLTMAIEGEPAQQVLAYDGAVYDFVVEGRGATREVTLDVNGAQYEFSANADGDLLIADLPASAPLPAILPAGSFEIDVEEREAFYVNVFYLALALIVMGVGCLKANISSIVGQLYPQGDPRRDPGFTLYYYGINLGAFWSAALCGLLGQSVGWWAGFGLAGIGMAIGYVVFVLGKPLLEGKGEPPDPEKLAEPVVGPLNREWIIYIAGILGVGGVWVLLQQHAAVGWALAAGSIGVLSYLGWYMAKECTRVEIERMVLALILIAASVMFWTLFEQAGSSMNQFADRNTVLSFGITAGQTQSFNAGFILLLAPAFSFLWARLGRRRLDPNTPMKFSLALLQVGAGFLLLVFGVNFADESFRVPMIFLAGAYLLHTTGELCLSPVGLSMVTKLATPVVVSTLMGVWFLSSAGAQYLGGLIAQFTAAETVAGQVLNPEASLNTYASVFQTIGLWSIALGVVLGVCSFWLAKLAHGALDTGPAEPGMEAGGPSEERGQVKLAE
ncbi:MAG: peptide MFS transporter [Maricaulaceae bacterium]